MAKLNDKYEALILLSLKNGEENVKSIIDKMKELISTNATIDSVDEWGKRRMAYPIMDENDGYYVLFHFTSEPNFPAEFDRVLKITDGVLRSLITLKLPE